MHIEHGLKGGRKVVSERNGARVVTTGKRGGYVQRPYVVRNGHTYVQRTYVVNNVTYTGVYRSYYYGGGYYYGYYPPYYYQPAYYGWAYNPWPAPAYYQWGYYNDPWYGNYNYYYRPYPAYPTASWWLTDYMMSENLRAAYEAQLVGAAGAPHTAPDSADTVASLWSTDFLIAASLTAAYGGQPYALAAAAKSPSSGGKGDAAQAQLSPEVKQAIADEVKRILAAEQAAAKPQQGASGGDQTPPALDPDRVTFVVSSDLDVTIDEGEECALTSGDVLTRLTNTPDEDKNVSLKVAASKKTDCAVGKQIAVSVDNLQEMYNHFHEQVDSGLKTLAAKQGKDGLPAAPDTSTVGGEVPPPAPDTTATKALQDQQQAADQAESEVQTASATGGGK